MQKELTQTLAETEDKKNQLADMTADQVAAQIDAEVQNIRDLQKKVQLLETLVQQAADAGIGADEILQELNHVNTILDDGIQQAYSLLQTADKAFDLADEILQTANVTVDELEQGMQDITTVYEERWSGMLDGMFGNLHSTLNDLDEALVRADAAIPEVYGLLEYGGETKDKGSRFFSTAK